MNIIFQKNSLYTDEDFFSEVQINNNITGVFLNVIETKDEKIIVINPNVEKNISITDFTLSDLSYLSVLTLEETLGRLSNTTKKIIINLLPINLFDFTEENLEKIKKDAEKRITIVKNIIDKYPKLNIYICSSVQRTIFLIEKIITNRKIGIIITDQNFNYIDVEFYVMGINLLNYSIINQQISLKKEVMIKVDNEKEFSTLKVFFNNSLKTPYDIKSYLKLQFITNTPNIFYEEFSKQLNLLPELN